MPKKINSEPTVVHSLRLSTSEKEWLDSQQRATGLPLQDIVKFALSALKSSVEYHNGRLIVPVDIPSIVKNEINLERRVTEALDEAKERLISELKDQLSSQRDEANQRIHTLLDRFDRLLAHPSHPEHPQPMAELPPSRKRKGSA